MTIPTTIGTTPRDLASRLATVAELVEDFAQLGEINHVYCTHDQIAIRPAGLDTFARLRVVALWAQRADVPVDLLAMTNHVTVKCAVPYRGLTITVDEAVYGGDMWELSRRLQQPIGNTGITVTPDDLLAALESET